MHRIAYKSVIFDLDGTLVDSIKNIASAINKVLKSFDEEPQDVSRYRNRVGWGLRKSLELTMPGLSPEELDSAMIQLNQYYREDSYSQTEAYEGIHDLLAHLNKKGIVLFVYTNKDQLTAQLIIDNLFPSGTFHTVFGARSGLPLKPDVRGIQEIIRQTGFNPDEILYVGDSEVDMQTAIAGKLDVLAVLWGYGHRKQLEEYKKLAYIKKADEIAGWIV